jgi:hypothetical protein
MAHTVFYVVTSRVGMVKFGVSSGDGQARLKAHRRDGFLDVRYLVTGLPEGVADGMERMTLESLAGAGHRPVHGREYFLAEALEDVLRAAQRLHGSFLRARSPEPVRPWVKLAEGDVVVRLPERPDYGGISWPELDVPEDRVVRMPERPDQRSPEEGGDVPSHLDRLIRNGVWAIRCCVVPDVLVTVLQAYTERLVEEGGRFIDAYEYVKAAEETGFCGWEAEGLVSGYFA